MAQVFDDWRDNVSVFCEDAAICWKAAQPKDLEKIRSENSEDALTWQFFRTLEEHGLVSKWASHFLGVEDDFTVFYWQRRRDHSELDPDIDACLARIEPIHRERNRQHTETDLILRGGRTLVMTEVKLGYKERPITGWRQAENSPIMPTYERPARDLIATPDEWKATLSRFAQLYKNLMLGQCLAEKWSRDSTSLELHLLAIVNGAAEEILADGSSRTYPGEFRIFCESCILDQNRLHLVTWQELSAWICGQANINLDFVAQRLRSHPLL